MHSQVLHASHALKRQRNPQLITKAPQLVRVGIQLPPDRLQLRACRRQVHERLGLEGIHVAGEVEVVVVVSALGERGHVAVFVLRRALVVGGYDAPRH